MFDLKTKQGKLFNALVLNGETLTASQISKRFSIKNPTATISDIRYAGFAIYGNKRTAVVGTAVVSQRRARACTPLNPLSGVSGGGLRDFDRPGRTKADNVRPR